MQLLVTTQVVNKNDTNLGFFHEWLKRLAANVDKLYVVCLFKGESDLPSNVEVISLGKEWGRVSPFVYSLRFYKALWKLRGKYNGVFVHMNPEYAILAGWLWRLTDKKVLLWYVHKAVNLRLRLGTLFATKIFTTSKESFRLSSKKIEVVGHGIPVEIFNDPNYKNLEKLKGSTLFLMSVGRVTPSKDWETVVLAIADIQGKKLVGLPSILFLVAGAPIGEEDKKYEKRLNEFAMSKNVGLAFNTYPWETNLGGMPYFYQNQHILIHTSRTGSMDKVVLEALAAGRIVVTSSEAYAYLADGELKNVLFRFPPGDYKELAKTIEKIYGSGILNSIPNQQGITYVRQHHNLDNLVSKIINYFKSV